MTFTLDQAKAEIYKVLQRKPGTAPEATPALFEEHTVEKPWGWIFHYNNERYVRSGDIHWMWVGHGPIFFNRDTGEIRQLGSGCDRARELSDYENELAARNGSWCLWLSDDQERAATIFKLKTAFSLNTTAARALVPKLPHALFAGMRRHLEWVAAELVSLGVATTITLEQATDVAQQHFVLPEHMINRSLAQAYHQRWDV